MKTTNEQISEMFIRQGKNLLETGYYNEGAHKIADGIGLKMTVKPHSYGFHFEGDKQKRHIFKVTLKKDGKQFSFKFGQSVAEGSNEPTMYDVLSCLTKYEVGDFEDFCNEFGYEQYNDYGRQNKDSLKTYRAVVKEFEGMKRLFNSEELELLQEIQ